MNIVKEIDKVVDLALQEDCAYNDVTSKNLSLETKTASAVLIVKSDGIICGIDVFKYVLLKLDNISNNVKNIIKKYPDYK